MDMKKLKQEIITAVEQVKEQTPLAGSITNAVTMNFVANAQLACGGSAAMVYLADEGECLAQMGNSVYLNMGTLLPVHEESMVATAKALHEAGRTCVVDPVGLGIGALRTEILKNMKPYKPLLIRGNASEIIALANLWELKATDNVSNAKGVDTTESVDEASQAAVCLAKYTGGAVAISGPKDLVTDGERVLRLAGGSPMMEKVTGCGCSLGGVMAVYSCVTNPFVAAVASTCLYNLAGDRAAAKVQGPGNFYAQFLDEIYLASAEDIANYVEEE